MLRASVFAAALITLANCLPGDPPANQFQPPGLTDQRCACPYMNTLANHGFVKRSGVAVTRDEVNSAFEAVFNIDPIITDVIFTAALVGTTSQIPNTINFVDLNQHWLIEHDGSLSRDDAAIGNNFEFNQTIWNQMTAFFVTPLISIEQMAAARVRRINRQRNTNPIFRFDDKAAAASLAETALILMTFANGSIEGGADRQQVDTFFTHERLPFDQGYTVPALRITADRVQALGLKMANVTGASALSSGSHIAVSLAAYIVTLVNLAWMLL